VTPANAPIGITPGNGVIPGDRVIPGFMPGIHLSLHSGARRRLDPGDKPRDDSVQPRDDNLPERVQ
jgi:hypothetical protein